MRIVVMTRCPGAPFTDRMPGTDDDRIFRGCRNFKGIYGAIAARGCVR